MKNCLIFGSGRSGTSMLSGMLHDSGYYMGEDMYPSRHSNPKGFFETALINGINESILKHYDNTFWSMLNMLTGRSNIYAPFQGQRWLMYLKSNVTVSYENKYIASSIREAIDHDRFAYKDPRFSYTLNVWEKYIPEDTVYLVVFREPGRTVESIIKECKSVEYLNNLAIDYKSAYMSWYSIYSYILKNHDILSGRFKFVHYNQLLGGEAIDEISQFLCSNISGKFVDRSLRRSDVHPWQPDYVKPVYDRLCQLSGYKE